MEPYIAWAGLVTLRLGVLPRDLAAVLHELWRGRDVARSFDIEQGFLREFWLQIEIPHSLNIFGNHARNTHTNVLTFRQTHTITYTRARRYSS